MFLFAKYKLNGVFEVLDTPKITTSASFRPFISFPSSYFTANSKASILLKYSAPIFLFKPGFPSAFTPNFSSKVLSISLNRSITFIFFSNPFSFT